jgi:alpha-1,2-mannosyltransferase
VSLWNFVEYNVIDGGESALYGVESSNYYLRNGLLNFNIIFLLAMAFPLVMIPIWPSLCMCSPLLVASGVGVSRCREEETERAPLLPIMLQLLFLHWFTSGRLGIRTEGPSKAPLLLALCPAFVWTIAISALPHKEERFLYVVYPLVIPRLSCHPSTFLT